MRKTPAQKLSEENRRIVEAKRQARRRGIASPYKLAQAAKKR